MRNNRYILQILALALTTLIQVVGQDTRDRSAQPEPPRMRDSRFLATRYTTASGLPQNTIRGLMQSSEGYLWIATRAGLARYDGTHFVVFNRENTPVIQNENCVCLLEDAEGTLWIGTEGGLICYKNHEFSAVPLSKDLKEPEQIRFLTRSHGGGIWISTHQGLFHKTGERIERYGVSDGLYSENIRAVFETSKQEVWVSSDIDAEKGGVQILDSQQRKFTAMPGGEVRMETMAHQFVEDRQGLVWWGDNQGLHYRDPQSGNRGNYTVTNGLLAQVVKKISLTSDGRLILVCGLRGHLPGKPGVQIFHGGSFETFSIRDYSFEEDVICAIQDREGSYWLGTRKDGLIQLRTRHIQAITPAEGLSHEHVTTVASGRNGELFLGLREQGVDFYSEGRVRSTGIPWQYWNGPVRSMFFNAENNLIAGEIQSLRSWRNGQPLGYLKLELLDGPDPELTLLKLLQGSELLIGWNRGLIRMRRTPGHPDPWENEASRLPALSGKHVTSIEMDAAGNKWIGTRTHGLIRLFDEDRQTEVFDTRHGLPTNSVLTLHLDFDSTLWVGTEMGLSRFRNGRFSTLTRSNGLAHPRVHSLVSDRTGQLWIGGLRGITCALLKDLNAVADGLGTDIHPVVFGEADGMPSSETSGDHQPAVCQLTDGRICFATIKGAALVDPRTITRNLVPPGVAVEEVRVDRQVVLGNAGRGSVKTGTQKVRHHRNASGDLLHLSPGTGREIQISFTANTFLNSQQTRFRIRLNGHESGWNELEGWERKFTYTNLKPKEYQFEVEAANNHGVWGRPRRTLSIRIDPTFSQTTAFPVVLVLAGLGVGLAALTIRLRWQSRALKAQRLAAVSSERARIARDLHDSLGAGLTGLALQLEGASRDKGLDSRVLMDMASEAREMAVGVRELSWATNPGCDDSESLASFLGDQTVRFARAAGLQCELDLIRSDAPIAVPSGIRHEILIMTREIFANISRHSHAKSMRLRLEVTPRMANLEISDDGVGIQTARSNGGTGLRNLKDRLIPLKGDLRIIPAPGGGTHVKICIPIPGPDTPPRSPDHEI